MKTRSKLYLILRLWALSLLCMLALSGCTPAGVGTTAPAADYAPTRLANDTSQPGIALMITPTAAQPGEAIQIRGSGFQSEEAITIVVYAEAHAYLYGAQAQKNGEYLQEIILLETLPTGIAIKIEATGSDSGHQLTGGIQITTPARGG